MVNFWMRSLTIYYELRKEIVQIQKLRVVNYLLDAGTKPKTHCMCIIS